MRQADPLRVELVRTHPQGSRTGIGRYQDALALELAALGDVRPVRLLTLGQGARWTWLRHLPLGIAGHRAGSVVHFPQIMGCALMLWRPAHPAVATVHDLGYLDWPPEAGMLDPLARLLLRFSLAGLKRADRIIADSEFTRQSVLCHLGRRPETVIAVYAGVDRGRFRPEPDARPRLLARYPALREAGPGPWLLTVGNELPRKNLAGLLRALAWVGSEWPALRLVKVGGAGGARFRAATEATIAALGLAGRVVLVDEVPDADLSLFYAAADLYVQASLLEGFCFPVLEAMACGAPVVCTDAGSLPEVVGEAARIVPAGDDRALAEAIGRLLTAEPERARLAAAGRQRAMAFQWSRCAQETWAVYEMAARSRAANARRARASDHEGGRI